MKTKPVYMMKGRRCVPLSQCGDNFGYCLDIDTMETFFTYGFNTAHFNKKNTNRDNSTSGSLSEF